LGLLLLASVDLRSSVECVCIIRWLRGCLCIWHQALHQFITDFACHFTILVLKFVYCIGKSCYMYLIRLRLTILAYEMVNGLTLASQWLLLTF
jgi:hypothetical protein